MITVGERGQRDRVGRPKAEPSNDLIKSKSESWEKKAVQGGEQAARQGDGQECGQVV